MQKFLIYLNTFLSGMAFLSLELLATRIIAPHFGNTIILLGSLLSIMLFGLSLGYFSGGWIIDKRPEFKFCFLVSFISAIWVYFIPSLENVALIKIIQNNTSHLSLIVFIFILFFIPSILMGMISPFIIKLNTEKFQELGISAGNIYGISTLGSIAGSSLTSFYLVPTFTTTEIINIIALSLLIVSLLFAYIAYINKESIIYPIFISFFLTFILLAKFQFVRENTLIYEKNSLYQKLSIFDKDNIRYLQADNLIQSAQNLENKNLHPLKYTQGLMIAGAFKKNIEINDILVIGLGAGTVSSSYLNVFPKAHVTSIEIDKDVFNLAKKYFHLKENKNHKIILEDGRQFINKNNKQYDIIILDAYKGNYIPFHLLTKEFFQELNTILKVNGIIASNTWESNSGFFKEINTYKKVFKHVNIYKSGKKNRIILASNHKQKIKNKTYIKSIKENYDIDINKILKNKETISIPNDKHYSDKFAPVNFDRLKD